MKFKVVSFYVNLQGKNHKAIEHRKREKDINKQPS